MSRFGLVMRLFGCGMKALVGRLKPKEKVMNPVAKPWWKQKTTWGIILVAICAAAKTIPGAPTTLIDFIQAVGAGLTGVGAAGLARSYVAAKQEEVTGKLPKISSKG